MDFAFVTVYVKNMEQSMDFYHKVLGLDVQTYHPIGSGGKMAMLGKEGQPNIELLYSPFQTPEAYTGFSVGIAVDSLEKAVQELESMGYPVIRGPYSPSPSVRFSFIKDPNGIEVQLIEKAG